ncbi:MAG TPA: hypothetical protein VGS21_08090 [Acidimicrobiales bacterium]|nr:hypothetical protein [Acidimicrobiales bacterium]
MTRLGMASATGGRRRIAALAAAVAGVAFATPALLASGPAGATTATHAVVGAPYRHGLVPMRGYRTTAAACSTLCVKYGGGIDNVGVTNGKEKVYLVFWGTQWGTAGTNSAGYTTYSGDSQGMAVILQELFKGLGSSLDKWSAVVTQYCQGVATGATTCPSTASHVAYPTGGALAGVWEDIAGPSPVQSTGHQLAVEAEAAAAHFGNTTAALNRDAQYVIVSPTGTNPDNYKLAGFCAWHDYSLDSTLDGGGAASGPAIAFTNLPYVTDVGKGCGAGAVDGKNTDGITIIEGQQYADTVTDQFPAGGWVNSSGEQVGDLCAWKTSGAGRMADITLSTGTFAMQGIWSNSATQGLGGCATSGRIIR